MIVMIFFIQPCLNNNSLKTSLSRSRPIMKETLEINSWMTLVVSPKEASGPVNVDWDPE